MLHRAKVSFVYLTDPPHVDEDLPLRYAVVNLEAEEHAGRLPPVSGAHNLQHLVNGLPQARWKGLDSQLAELDLGHVEGVVDAEQSNRGGGKIITFMSGWKLRRDKHQIFVENRHQKYIKKHTQKTE